MAEMAERIATLEAESEQNKNYHVKLNGSLDKIWTKLDEITNVTLKRYSPITTITWAALCSLCSALIVYIVTH
ncbi:MAG TPA: hypothetical protein VGK02_06280 [Candidatus Aquicultor sp.]|jgi:hypothetical protein